MQKPIQVVLKLKHPTMASNTVDYSIEISKTVKLLILFFDYSNKTPLWASDSVFTSTTHPSELKTWQFYDLSTGPNPSIHINVWDVCMLINQLNIHWLCELKTSKQSRNR